GRGRRYTIPFLFFEEAVLGLLAEVKPSEVLPGPGRDRSRAAATRAALAKVRGRIEGLKADLRKGHSRGLSDLLREAEAEEERLAGRLLDELAKEARPRERSWGEVPTLVDAIRKAEDPDGVRVRLRAVLTNVIDSICVLIVPRPRPGRPQGSVR